MKNILLTIGLLVALIAVGTQAQAVPPNPVASIYTYQGAIFVDDVPFDGTGLFKMAIVDGLGQTLWSNDGTSVDGSQPAGDVAAAVDSGVFVILLGDDTIPGMTAIDPALFATNETLYLKTWFDDGTHGFAEMTPSIQLTASTFAINAQFLQGYGPADFFLNSSQITSSQIATGAVTSTAIAGGAVGSTQIATGAVTDDKITAFTDARTFNVGDASGNNVQIVAAIGAANDPALRYDTVGSAWQYTNDGLVWNDIGSGGGGGGVDPGLQNQLAWYESTGSTVKGLATANNGVLVTSGAGAPSIASTLPLDVQTNIVRVGIVGEGIWQSTTAPIADTYVADDLTISGGTVDNSIIGGATAAAGTFTDLVAELDAVIEGGDATVGVGSTAYAGRVILHDADAGDGNTTTVQSHADVGTSFALVLPADGGSAGQVLTTDGTAPNAQLSWTDAASGNVTGPVASTDNAVARFDGTGGKILQNSGVIITDTTNDVSGIGALSITSMGADWTNAGRTIADLGTVTTADINGGTIDGAGIGQSTADVGSFTALDAASMEIVVPDGAGVPGLLVDNNDDTNSTAGVVIDLTGAGTGTGGIPLILVPTDIPSQTTSGGLYVDSTDHKLYYRSDTQWIDLTVGGTAMTAKFILQQPEPLLPNEQALSELATGLMQATTGTGVVSSVTTSAGISSLLSDETGSGALVFGTSPTLISPTVNTSLTMQNSSWLGLGAGAGRIQFVDDVTDKIYFEQANVGIMKSDPLYPLDVTGTARATGGFLAPYGTAATPGFRFDTDPDTGMYRAAADTLAFSTNGTEQMRIDPVGRVAIGTTTFDIDNPEHFVVDGGTDTSVNVMSAYGEINNQLRMNIRNRSAGDQAATAFAASADNSAFSHFTAMGVTSSGFDDPAYTIADPNDGFLFVMGGDLLLGTASAGSPIRFHTGGVATDDERMIIMADGRVGIGQTVPAAKLEVEVSDGDNVPGILIDNRDTTNSSAGLLIDVEAGQGIPLIIKPMSSPPAVVVEGGLYANAADNKLYYRTDSAWVDLTSGGGGGAPAGATYITQTPDAILTNEQALSLLGTGLMQVTTATGAVSSVTTSLGVAGLIGDETGSGALVFGTSPTLDGTTAITGSPTAVGATWANLGSVTTIDINGGTIDNAAIGGATPAAGAFTTLSSSGQYTNTVTDGTAPMAVTSTTVVSNLNADYLDGQDGAYYLDLVNATIAGQAQGDVLYFNGTNWARLQAGSSGEYLQTQGAGFNPQWASPAGSGTVNAGTTGQVAYYAADGTTVSGTSSLSNTVQDNITRLGTVTVGTWNGTAIDETHGGTDQTTYTTGDILYASAADTLTKLAIGNVNEILTVIGGVPAWSSTAGGGANTTLSNLVSPTAVNQDLLPNADNTLDLGSAASSWNDAWFDGTATIASVDINGGTIDGATIGAATPSEGSFLALQTGSDGTDGQLTIFSEQGATDYAVIFQPNAAMTMSTTYTLPPDDGTGGQFLSNDGLGALSWSSPSGSGTVNTGSINQMAYYAANGDAVSGLATANDGVLVTSGAGVPSISSTLPTAVQGNITQVGTVTTGIWNATAIDETHGGTNQTTYAAGDMLYASAANTLSKLAISAEEGAVMTVSSGAPAWVVYNHVNSTLDNLTAPTAINEDLLPNADNTLDLGSALLSWADAWFDGTVTIATADINGGNIDGTTIGAATPAAGSFTTLTTNAQAGLTISPFGVGAGNTGEFRFYELAGTGAQYVGFKAPDSIGTERIWTLPSADGTSGQVLITNGLGVLGWSSAGAGTITAVGSMTSGAAFADASASGDWLGLGASAGRIAFSDEVTDKISFLQANVGIGTSAVYPLDVLGTARVTDILAGNGSVSSPAYRFDQDTNTGMYRAAEDNLGLVTNGTERVRISEDGLVGIGSTTFDEDNPEKLLVDNSTDVSPNIISARGDLNNYLQLNIKNINGGDNASSDIVATADVGDDANNYIDMGINSSAYGNLDYSITGPLDGYLYVDGGDLAIGTATTGKIVKFHTAGTTSADERMRITDTGVGIMTQAAPTAELEVKGDVKVGEALTIGSDSTPSGTAITRHLSASAAVDLPNIASRTCGQQSIAVTGAVAGDTVVCAPTPTAGGIETLNLSWNCYVSAADPVTVEIRACNPTTGAINPPSQTWRADVWQH